MYLKIMSAMPSERSFSIQLFIESWNNSGKIPRIHPSISDVEALAEGHLTNLQFKQYASRPPVVTEFLGSFKCPRYIKGWAMQIQAVIPLLQLPPKNLPADVSELLADFIVEKFENMTDYPLHCPSMTTQKLLLEISINFERALTKKTKF